MGILLGTVDTGVLAIDSGTDVEGSVDAGVEGAVADAMADSDVVVEAGETDSGVFGPAELVPGLAETGFIDFKETLTADMLDLYFCSDRPGGPGSQNVWHTSRMEVTDPWATPECVVEVSSAEHETGPAVSPDGLTLWVSSDRPGGKGGYDIWVSTRPSRTATWSTPTPVTELNTTSDEFPRPPIKTGLVMPPSYRSTPINQFQTYFTSRPDASSAWTAPIRATDVDTSNIDTDAFLTDDQLTLYFSSDRAVQGEQQLFVAQRSDPSAAFTSFAPIGELNVIGSEERDPWVSPDGHEIYFSSDRTGTLHIYHATR
jgi:hypothetical protein